MTTLAHTATSDFAASKAKRITISSDVRAAVYAVAMIGTITVATFALLSSQATFTPSLAKDRADHRAGS